MEGLEDVKKALEARETATGLQMVMEVIRYTTMALKSQKARQKIHFMRFGSWAIILHQLLVAKSSGALRV